MEWTLHQLLAIYARNCIDNELLPEGRLWYQYKTRIYLDEYEVEEVDLRVNFDTFLLMKRFMVKK